MQSTYITEILDVLTAELTFHSVLNISEEAFIGTRGTSPSDLSSVVVTVNNLLCKISGSRGEQPSEVLRRVVS
jgi:hypothetical protein